MTCQSLSSHLAQLVTISKNDRELTIATASVPGKMHVVINPVARTKNTGVIGIDQTIRPVLVNLKRGALETEIGWPKHPELVRLPWQFPVTISCDLSSQIR